MRPILLLTLSLSIPLAFVLGMLVARPAPPSVPAAQDIAQVQAGSDVLFPPIWQRMFRDRPWLKALRRGGYLYCSHDGTIDADCAHAQDEALQDIVFALMISKGQQGLADRSPYRLSQRESEVARNPALRSRIIRYCARLYTDHGGQDARVLAVCLGNLSDFSPLVPIPVP